MLVAGNAAAEFGGAVYAMNKTLLSNVTMWNNTAAVGAGLVVHSNKTVSVSLYNSIVTDVVVRPDPVSGLRATVDVQSSQVGGDPRFVDAENGDYTLKASSPCVNAGANSYVAAGEKDLLGNPRVHVFGGKAKYDVVDMGCYESPHCRKPGLEILVR